MKLNYFRDPCFPLSNLFFRLNNTFISNWLRKEETGWILSRSTWSIVIIILLKLKSKKKLNIWIPSYYCSEVIDIIKMLDINIIFYDLEDSLSPSIDNLKILLEKNPPDIFILVHYYSEVFKFNQLKLLFKNLDTWIIEDATQCFVPSKIIGSVGHFILYSPYKFLPISSGAILVLTEKGKITKLNNEIFNSLVEEIDTIYTNFFNGNSFHYMFYLKLFLKSFLKFFRLFPYSPSTYEINHKKLAKLQKPRLTKLDQLFLKICTNQFDSLVNKRKENLAKAKQAFLAVGNKKLISEKYLIFLKNNNDKNFLPLTFPIFLNKTNNIKKLYYSFFKIGIELNVWPDLPSDIINNQKYVTARNYRLRILHFPIHQSIELSTRRLKFVLKKLLK